MRTETAAVGANAPPKDYNESELNRLQTITISPSVAETIAQHLRLIAVALESIGAPDSSTGLEIPEDILLHYIARL